MKNFLPFMFDEESEKMEKLDWEDFKISCPSNRQFARKILHQRPFAVKCEATGFQCEPVSCPFLYWLSFYYKYGENIFQFMDIKKH